ncbi:MAG: hypothetical protein Q9216_002538 [Gyalolechia sp. 2 TL-2023]
MAPRPQKMKFSYTTLTGYFLQDDPGTVAEDFDFMSKNFGLMTQNYTYDGSGGGGGGGGGGEEVETRSTTTPRTQWQRFEREVQRLNASAEEGEGEGRVLYKVLYLGRHGQGVHNVAEQRYGREEWDDHDIKIFPHPRRRKKKNSTLLSHPSISRRKAESEGEREDMSINPIPIFSQRYYASLEGDSHGHWSDAHLTATGIQQARSVNGFWKRQIAGQAKTPAPETYYTSPLYRCLQTANLTFAGLDLPPDRPYEPLVKELLREANGVHTCDRRSSLSFLRSSLPNCSFEPGFSEEDELWSASRRETDGELDARMKELLDDVFGSDSSTFVSFTSHSGAISSLLRVLGHREFRLVTGGVIPVLVRAKSVVE